MAGFLSQLNDLHTLLTKKVSGRKSLFHVKLLMLTSLIIGDLFSNKIILSD